MTSTRQKLPKAAITRLMHRAQLAEFTTQQHGDQVLLTCNTADLEYFENALRVAGFSFDFVTISKHGRSTAISYGLNTCSFDDYTSDKISLIVSLRWTKQQADDFIKAAAVKFADKFAKAGA